MSSTPTSPALAMTCPISVLSAELLTLILDLVLTTAYENDVFACGPDDDSVAHAARLTASLARVCVFWRAVIRGNPLWHDTLSLVPPWWHHDLERRLERSAQVPLDLRIFGHADFTTSRSTPATTARMSSGNSNSDLESLYGMLTWAEYKPLFELLAPHFSRCRALQIRGVFTKDSDIPFYMLERLLDMDMPLLETFIFEAELSYYDDYMALRGLKPLFRSAPRLQQLRLVGIGISRFTVPSSCSLTSFEILSPSASSSTLTTLHLSPASSRDSTSFSDLQRVLASCLLLHTLVIYNDALQHFPGPQAYGTCSTPALDTLFILGSMVSVSELLLFLDAPKLRELIIAPLVPSDLTLLMAVLEEEEERRPSSASVSIGHRFQNLTTLTIAPAHLEAFEAVSSASACFPFIEHLILATVYLTPFKLLFAGGLGAEGLNLADGQIVYSSDEGDGLESDDLNEDDDEMHGGGELRVDEGRRDEPGAGAGVHAAQRSPSNISALGGTGDSHVHTNSDSDNETDVDADPITHNSNDSTTIYEVWERKTLFPNMVDIALTDVDGRFAQAICDMQVLRGFSFEDAQMRRRAVGSLARNGTGNRNENGIKNGNGNANDNDNSNSPTNSTSTRKWKSKHSAKTRKLRARTRGAGSACVPLQNVYLDAASYDTVRRCGYVWDDRYYDSQDEDEDEGPCRCKTQIKDFDRYVQKADMWDVRRKTMLFTQMRDLYVGQPAYGDD
ncbi:hypothetical protein CVT25_015349 [Psilocybe cyanescens]|uniref:F-box domain-containing protein n=1 Tax=Psilocybe cyanescens TaxID=93625 RepID=A0A409WH91_PSICY|nr:hypothetical protein CVT25_015349 [Psilocybe cyanescens]